ncbi:MAG: DUF3164 family protein [Spartobacteria bacterium]|nr:DUF3164 family protein [Spartobacteria bacterium]
MKKQYYIDPMGDKIPARHVKAYDKLRDRIANQIARAWADEEARLCALKERTIELIERLQTAAAKDAGVKDLGGPQGNVQFRSFDGSITVCLDNAKRTEFDERLHLAQELIMQAVRELADGEHNADLIEIATKAFQPRRSGNLDMQRIRDLKTYKVRHPKWKKAIEIISECERTIGHRQYVRVSTRDDKTKKPRNIMLDIAKV